MGRPPCCDKVGVKKGPWTPEEDIVLVSHIQQHGPGNWRSVPIRTGLSRCSKSCRLRWTNYLRPGIKRGKFTPHEEGLIIHLQALLGNKWAAIASHLPQRTDNDVKNYWNTHLKKKLERIQSFHTSENQFTPSPSNSSASKLDSNSVYAWSSENVSRLLENWMVTAPAKENGIKVKQEGNGDLMSKEELETILSFENLNEVPWERSSCDSDEKGLEKMVDGDIAEIAFDRKNQGSLDHALPSSFIEKWIVDDATFEADKMLELSSISQ